jgi:hypothetical protein
MAESTSISDPLVIVTIILVAVTGYYAYQTRNTVKEMKKGNEMQFLPSLVVTYYTPVDTAGGIRKIRFLVHNVGKGTALDVRINLSIYGKSVIPDNFQFPLLHVEEQKTLTGATISIFVYAHILMQNRKSRKITTSSIIIIISTTDFIKEK